jgi:hypothetical protein
MLITSGGTGSKTLTNTSPGIWTGSYDFINDGTYVIELKADDGIGTPVTASVIDIGVGDSGGIYAETLLGPLSSYTGVAMIGCGAILMYYGFKRRD